MNAIRQVLRNRQAGYEHAKLIRETRSLAEIELDLSSAETLAQEALTSTPSQDATLDDGYYGTSGAVSSGLRSKVPLPDDPLQRQNLKEDKAAL